jgi:hypothetical protein
MDDEGVGIELRFESEVRVLYFFRTGTRKRAGSGGDGILIERDLERRWAARVLLEPIDVPPVLDIARQIKGSRAAASDRSRRFHR